MKRLIAAVAVALLLSCRTPANAQAGNPTWIVGTWILTAADKLLPDGSRVEDYGPKPHGLAIFTADGYYSIQIYRAQRLPFASGDKFEGSLEEYKDVALGMSTGFGRYRVDQIKHVITFHRDRSSVPNFDDKTVVDPYELNGDVLTWKVAARKDGSIPITVVQKAK